MFSFCIFADWHGQQLAVKLWRAQMALVRHQQPDLSVGKEKEGLWQSVGRSVTLRATGHWDWATTVSCAISNKLAQLSQKKQNPAWIINKSSKDSHLRMGIFCCWMNVFVWPLFVIRDNVHSLLPFQRIRSDKLFKAIHRIAFYLRFCGKMANLIECRSLVADDLFVKWTWFNSYFVSSNLIELIWMIIICAGNQERCRF